MNAVNTLRLCERLNLTPDELDACDPQVVTDWMTILRYEAELAKAKATK